MKPDYIIFPDASTRRIGKKVYNGYAVVVLNANTNKYTVLKGSLSSESTVFAEGWAIYQGLRFIRHKTDKQNLKIAVFSDSKINIQILNDYIPHCWKLDQNNNWVKRDGTSPKNQELYKGILQVMYHNNYKVKFVHILSHTLDNPHKHSGLKNHLSEYGINIHKSTINTLVHLNDLADRTAQAVTKQERDDDMLGKYYKLERIV